MHSLFYLLVLVAICSADEIIKPIEKNAVIHKKKYLFPKLKNDKFSFDLVDDESKSSQIKHVDKNENLDHKIEELENLRKTYERRSEHNKKNHFKNYVFRETNLDKEKNHKLDQTLYLLYGNTYIRTGQLKKCQSDEENEMKNKHDTDELTIGNKNEIDTEDSRIIQQKKSDSDQPVEAKIAALLEIKKMYEDINKKNKRKLRYIKLKLAKYGAKSEQRIKMEQLNQKGGEDVSGKLVAYDNNVITDENNNRDKKLKKLYEKLTNPIRQGKLKIPYEDRKYKKETYGSKSEKAAAFAEYKRERNIARLIHEMDEDYDKTHKEKGLVRLSDLENDEKKLDVLENAFKKLHKNTGVSAIKHKTKLYAKHYLLPTYEEIVKPSASIKGITPA